MNHGQIISKALYMSFTYNCFTSMLSSARVKQARPDARRVSADRRGHTAARAMDSVGTVRQLQGFRQTEEHR